MGCGRATVLLEIRDVKQYEPNQTRRWFQSPFFDLYTWEVKQESSASEIVGFQLCYGTHGDQRALRWSPALGYRHEGVDAPEDKPGRAMSAIFVADGAFDAAIVADRFAEEADEMPPAVAAFVLAKIRAHPAWAAEEHQVAN
jgi:hypothetical protein